MDDIDLSWLPHPHLRFSSRKNHHRNNLTVSFANSFSSPFMVMYHLLHFPFHCLKIQEEAEPWKRSRPAKPPRAGRSEAEEAPTGAPEAEVEAEGKAMGSSAFGGSYAATGPGSKASSEEAAFPPDAPISGEAPMAEATSDNSARVTKVTSQGFIGG
jgi:hypothetical protein